MVAEALHRVSHLQTIQWNVRKRQPEKTLSLQVAVMTIWLKQYLHLRLIMMMTRTTTTTTRISLLQRCNLASLCPKNQSHHLNQINMLLLILMLKVWQRVTMCSLQRGDVPVFDFFFFSLRHTHKVGASISSWGFPFLWKLETKKKRKKERRKKK